MGKKNELAHRLRSERERRGWSIRKLESLSGVSNSAISLIEKGERPNPRITTIEKLADALKVSAPYLSGMTDDPNYKAPSDPNIVKSDMPIPPPGWEDLSEEEKEHVRSITQRFEETIIEDMLKGKKDKDSRG